MPGASKDDDDDQVTIRCSPHTQSCPWNWTALGKLIMVSAVAMYIDPFRWIAACCLIAASACSVSLGAESGNSAGPDLAAGGETNGSLAFFSSPKRAAWQRHLTLGPGDVLNLSLLDMP
jgi:hypothetical protein